MTRVAKSTSKTARAVAWSVKEVDGEYEVYQGTRRKRTWPDMEAALRWLKTRVNTAQGETVTLIEDDGYRVDITRKFTH